MIVFAFCLIYVALVYIRPGEIVPALANLRLPMLVLVAGSVAAAASLFMKRRTFLNLPADLCFVGFMAATMLSNPANGRFTVGPDGLEGLLPLVAFYLFIRIAIRTERQMRWLIGLVILLTMFQAGNGILQATTGIGLGGTTAVMTPAGGDPDDPDDTGEHAVTRVRGTGIFGDPNDLAMALVLVFPFLYTVVLDGEAAAWKRLGAILMLAVLAYAVYLTQSRGGFLGLAALTAAFAYRRFGRVVAVVGAVVLLVAVVATSGRGREISSSEASAQGRIQAWSAGFDMLRAKPVLGVGTGEFIRYHHRVAHNSFVHVFAEEGLVGLFFFVGMFYWFFMTNGTLRDIEGAAASPLARDLWASAIGVTVCACFLSRQYIPVLYLPLVLGASRITIAQEPDEAAEEMDVPVPGAVPSAVPGADPEQDTETRSIGRWWDWPLLGACTIGVVLLTYVVIRTLSA